MGAKRGREAELLEFQDQVSALRARCAAQEGALDERASEFNALKTEYSQSCSSRDALRHEVEQYKGGITAELNAALEKARLSEERSMADKVLELCTERDEA